MYVRGVPAAINLNSETIEIDERAWSQTLPPVD